MTWTSWPRLMRKDCPAEDWVSTRVPGGASMTVEVVVGPGGMVGGTTEPDGAAPVPEEPVPALGVVEDEDEADPEPWAPTDEDPVEAPEELPGEALRTDGARLPAGAVRAEATAADPPRRTRAARATQGVRRRAGRRSGIGWQESPRRSVAGTGRDQPAEGGEWGCRDVAVSLVAGDTACARPGPGHPAGTSRSRQSDRARH